MFLVISVALLSPAVAVGYGEKVLRSRIGTVVLLVISWVQGVSPEGFLSAHLSQHMGGHVVLASATACHFESDSTWQYMNCKNLFPCT